MERELCCRKDLLGLDSEISWVTSGLYDSKKEECLAEKSRLSFLPRGKKKHQFRRQSEPVVSDIMEVLRPELIHQNKFALSSGTDEEFHRFSNLPKGNIKQTFMHAKSAENSPQIRRRYKSSEKCFIVNLFIEAKAFHLGPFPFEIYPKMNVGLLKLKVEKELAIPTSFQKWILNKSLAIDNDLLLLDCDVIPGSPIFLYLDSNFEKSVDLDQFYSLIKMSADKSIGRHVGICHNSLLQYPLKTNAAENIERFTGGNKWDADNAHLRANTAENIDGFADENKCDSDNDIKNFSKKKHDKLVLAKYEEHDKRKTKIPDNVFEKCPQKSSSLKMKSENILPSKNVIAIPPERKFRGTKKGPFKPVFAKVKEKESYTILNNTVSNNAGCFTETSVADTSSSNVNSKNTSSKDKASDSSVAKSIFKSHLQIKAEKKQKDSNVENSSQPAKEKINVPDQNVSKSKESNIYDFRESFPTSDTCNKIPISSKGGQNSILEKVRMKQKIKFGIENENFDSTAKNIQYIQNKISGDIIIDKSTHPIINVNASQSEILHHGKLQTDCSNTSHGFSLKTHAGNIENNIKTSTSLSNQKEEEGPDFAETSTKDSKVGDLETEERSEIVKISMGTETQNLTTKEKSECPEIFSKNLKTENLPDSSEAQNIKGQDTEVFKEAGITEICIVNKIDEFSSESQNGNSDSIKNIAQEESSNSCNNGQDVEKEENEIVIKKCAENYERLVKMEDLNLVRNIMNFTCPVCFGDFESDQGVVLHECLHTFCIDCLARTIDYAEEVLVKCPYRDDEYSCQSYLQQREIKALVSPEIYERYLQRSIITAESLADKSFHCKTPDCPGWCMFDGNINVFHCPVCFHYNCLNCRTIHEGLNCRQYQDKLQSQKKIDPDSEKTLEFLNKMIESGKALRCPKCDLILMKKWGCDWLKCSVCLTEICWITKGPRWGPGGQGDTSGGCKCGVNGVKCHPSCTYCH